ncbi:MAG: glycosyltransferase [Desulfuromusa sp.]|jgi:1,2-diacylglycerol 3-alpha-glucosyltransferase|nr:glycosyltransferase [Desulfuromusa sp.]
MHSKKRLRLYLIAILLVMTSLIVYKVYLFIAETDYQALNADHIDQIETNLHAKSSYQFAVVGNIKNSMRNFEDRIAPLFKKNDIDLMISVGNAVYDGAEGKYRLLYRGLKKLDIPYILATGHNEFEDFGAGRFYRHFGPYFFSFPLSNAYFIFLDSSGKTSWKWQLRWLKKELKTAEKYPYRFIISAYSLIPIADFDAGDTSYLLPTDISNKLQTLFSQHRVTAVFSAGYPVYHQTISGGVRYIESGGGGGLLLDRNEHYQFVKVAVGVNQPSYENVVVPHRLGLFSEKLETLKLFLHSLFYMSLLNLLLILSIISLVALWLYSLIIRQEHLYRDFSVDEDAFPDSPLRIAMFTNNYLPFIGGVPLSINRLYRGLIERGATVKIFAPAYRQGGENPENDNVYRCPGLFALRMNNFPVANIFCRKILTEFNAFDGDLVHVHHPFWMGKKGMRLAKKRGIPVILTYHTRLERYTHYVPLPSLALKNLVAHFIIKHFANKCDAIITPTSSTEEYLRNLGVSALIETIPTGISVGDYKSWSEQQVEDLRNQYIGSAKHLLISVSRMAREKNLDFLIDGLAKAKNRVNSPFKCLLIGDGPEKTRLEAKVSTLGLAEDIIFTGNLTPNEVVRCYLAADLFVFASTSETQGMVLLEAMAGGCPVVAVRASGVYDVVKNGYNGFKVAESTEEWAETVAKLLADPQQLSTLSGNSKTFAQDYSVETITEKVSKLYQRVIVLNP